MTAPVDLPRAAWSLALAGLPGMGPARLLALHRAHGPREAWRRVSAGRVLDDETVARTLRPRPDEVVAGWVEAARRIDPAVEWARHQRPGLELAVWGDADYPDALAADLEPPAVLLWQGDVGVLDGPRVAVVGTRRCTRTGREVAAELGHDLATAGVRVVSGLASGIDAAAHTGAVAAGAAPPVAVVGSGPDVPYPRTSERLWLEVADRGVLLAEAPLGTRPAPWRFPARNRIIAALAHVVVVVESHASGGAMHTVEEALRRDRTVLAVPGSVRNPAAAGTNRLLHDGLGPARDALDVLTALGLGAGSGTERRPPERPEPSPAAATVLAAIGHDPVHLDHVAATVDRSPAAVALAVEELVASGWVHRDGAHVERRSGR